MCRTFLSFRVMVHALAFGLLYQLETFTSR
uniref:Uncharacterized protein n=1 Tax=Anguilla anguilla TaxID=7936 RepID=A0A0E9UZ88_ANGAN